MEPALCDVHLDVRPVGLAEAQKMAVRGLVGADVLGRHHRVYGHRETLTRLREKVWIDVRENCQLPALFPQFSERGSDVREHRPVGEGVAENRSSPGTQGETSLSHRSKERFTEHLSIGAEAFRLHLNLMPVVHGKEPLGLAWRHGLDRPCNPRAPVDQGAVAIERQPAHSTILAPPCVEVVEGTWVPPAPPSVTIDAAAVETGNHILWWSVVIGAAGMRVSVHNRQTLFVNPPCVCDRHSLPLLPGRLQRGRLQLLLSSF